LQPKVEGTRSPGKTISSRKKFFFNLFRFHFPFDSLLFSPHKKVYLHSAINFFFCLQTYTFQIISNCFFNCQSSIQIETRPILKFDSLKQMNFDFLMFSSLEKQSRLENSIKIQNNQIMSSLFLIKKGNGFPCKKK